MYIIWGIPTLCKVYSLNDTIYLEALYIIYMWLQKVGIWIWDDLGALFLPSMVWVWRTVMFQLSDFYGKVYSLNDCRDPYVMIAYLEVQGTSQLAP